MSVCVQDNDLSFFQDMNEFRTTVRPYSQLYAHVMRLKLSYNFPEDQRLASRSPDLTPKPSAVSAGMTEKQ